MRWARFEQNGTPTYGVVEGEEIIPVRGSPFDMWERTAARLPLASVKLLLPVVPPTFYAAGLNYAEHVREAAEKIGLKVQLPTQADAGYRANNALIAHGEAIVIPKDATDQVQYEGELVAVIGRKCKHLTRDNALSAYRLHDRQRRERANLAEERPHAVARQEHRHVQADGPVDRDQREAGRPGHQGAAERQGADRVPDQPYGVRRGRFPGGDDKGT